jgi:hypothetical protein
LRFRQGTALPFPCREFPLSRTSPFPGSQKLLRGVVLPCGSQESRNASARGSHYRVWRVVEGGDGQVSDRPTTTDPVAPLGLGIQAAQPRRSLASSGQGATSSMGEVDRDCQHILVQGVPGNPDLTSCMPCMVSTSGTVGRSRTGSLSPALRNGADRGASRGVCPCWLPPLAPVSFPSNNARRCSTRRVTPPSRRWRCPSTPTATADPGLAMCRSRRRRSACGSSH